VAQQVFVSRGSEMSCRPTEFRKAGAGGTRFLSLSLGSIGVVFGDIGTSPLYTFNSIFTEVGKVPDAEDVTCAFSLIFWTLTWVTCIKYLGLVMRVSHHKEGGSLALMQVVLEALHPRSKLSSPGGRSSSPGGSGDDLSDESDSANSEAEFVDEEGRSGHSTAQRTVIFLGMLSCSMLIGDGVITPPNSVLGALNTPVLTLSVQWVVVIAVVLLIITFALQRLGSKVIGQVAGPFMVVWFLTMGGLGLYRIVEKPELARMVAGGFNPYCVYKWFFTGSFRGWLAFKSLAGVVLCVTGAEALYADMGHFGAGPITAAWFFLIYPCLILQYVGQAMVIVTHPEAVNGNPFYYTAPPSLLWPVSILAVVAAIMASQALISGCFSILTQAHALEFIPRILVLHTNPDEKGQVYIPEANWMLMVACILVTVAFQTSNNLAGAYGIAVTGAFILTTLMLWWVLRNVWKLNLPIALLIILPMLIVDIVFWSANMMKLFSSGWVPIAMAVFLFLVMNTHNWGRRQEHALYEHQAEEEARSLAFETGGAGLSPVLTEHGRMNIICTAPGLLSMLGSGMLSRADTAGIFLTAREGRVPPSVRMLACAMGSLPKTIVLLHVKFANTPFVPEGDRYSFEALDVDLGLYSITMSFGYAEPLTATRFDVHATLGRIAKDKVKLHPALASLVPAATSRRAFTQEGNLSGTLMEEVEGPAIEGEDDPEGEPQHAQVRVTYVATQKTFAPDSARHSLSKLRVRLYSHIVSSGRPSLHFFGLMQQEALEVSRIIFL